jgi:hypothetical protein
MKELSEKFLTVDVKLLRTELSDHTLQTRFDVQARKSLDRWGRLVRQYLA